MFFALLHPRPELGVDGLPVQASGILLPVLVADGGPDFLEGVEIELVGGGLPVQRKRQEEENPHITKLQQLTRTGSTKGSIDPLWGRMPSCGRLPIGPEGRRRDRLPHPAVQRYAAAWIPYNSAYCPCLAISASWVPTSTTRAPSSTTIRSAMRTVLKRCDTRIVIRLPPRAAAA